MMVAFSQKLSLHSEKLPEPKRNTYVNDYTSSLSDEEIHNLNIQIKALEQKTTVQMAVLFIDRLPSRMSIEDYARAVGNEWKVGRNHNGIVYIAVLNERKQRLEIARNLESEIPDITAAEIIDQLKPYLGQKDYYGALTILVQELSYHLGVAASPRIDSTSEALSLNTYTSGTGPPAEVSKSDKDQIPRWPPKIGTF